MLDSFIKGVIRFRWLVVLVSLALVAVMIKGATQLQLTSNTKVFFDGDFKQRVESDYLDSVFERNINLSIVMTPKDGTIYSEPFLKLLYELTEGAWETPYATRVNSLTNYQHTSVDQDDLMVEHLVPDQHAITAERIALVKQVAQQEGELRGRLVSEAGDIAVIDIRFELPVIDSLLPYFEEIFAHVEAMQAEYALTGPEVEYRYSGEVFINNSFGKLMVDDLASLMPLVLVMISLLLLILLRSLTATVSGLVVMITSVIITMGAFGWMGYSITNVTSIAPIFITTLAVADAVHVITTMLVRMRQGEAKEQAILTSFHLNLRPIFITSITTAVGMLTLNFSESPPFRDLGNMVAAGVMVAFVLSITLLPALLAMLPIKQSVSNVDNTRMESFSDWVSRNPGKIFVGYGVFAFALSAAAGFNIINDEAHKYISENNEVRQTMDYVRENMSGYTMVDVGLFSGEEGHVSSPEFLAVLEDFSNWLRSHPSVSHAQTLSDTFKRLNRDMHGGDPDWYRIPDNQALAAQYLLLYELSLPMGLDISNQLDLDKSATRLYIMLEKTMSSEIVGFEQEVRQWFADNTPEMEVHVGGTNLMFAHIGEKNIPASIRGLVVAVVMISLMLTVSLRSWKLGIASILPNFLPIAMGFGVWGLYVGEINLGIATVASISIGVVVDDCVHFLSKYQYARSQNMTVEEAVRYSFVNVGQALLTTTIVLVAGFSVLLASNFLLLSGMGLITAMVILFALATDFLLLPAFLILMERLIAKFKRGGAQQSVSNL